MTDHHSPDFISAQFLAVLGIARGTVNSPDGMSKECSTQVQGTGHTMRCAGLDAAEVENVSRAELGSFVPLQTPGMKRAQEVGVV